MDAVGSEEPLITFLQEIVLKNNLRQIYITTRVDVSEQLLNCCGFVFATHQSAAGTDV